VVTVRLFAAARDAAGTGRLEITAGPVIPALLDRDLGPRFVQVLGVCSVVSDGYRLGPGDAVPDGATVDVLPPFAGG
jgi:molybdopterin converting factor small subunit